MYKIVFEYATVARRATYTLTSSFPATLFSFFSSSHRCLIRGKESSPSTEFFCFDYYSFVVGEPVGLFNSSSEKSLICRKRRDPRGLGHLYGNRCGETHL